MLVRATGKMEIRSLRRSFLSAYYVWVLKHGASSGRTSEADMSVLLFLLRVLSEGCHEPGGAPSSGGKVLAHQPQEPLTAVDLT